MMYPALIQIKKIAFSKRMPQAREQSLKASTCPCGHVLEDYGLVGGSASRQVLSADLLEVAVGAGLHDFAHFAPDVKGTVGQFRAQAHLLLIACNPAHVPVQHHDPDVLVGILHNPDAAGKKDQ